MSLTGDVIHQVIHPPICTSIYHSQGALKVFLLAVLLICVASPIHWDLVTYRPFAVLSLHLRKKSQGRKVSKQVDQVGQLL